MTKIKFKNSTHEKKFYHYCNILPNHKQNPEGYAVDKIFYLPITKASLVHGDYNTWNILADKKSCNVTAIIDPCGCMWADREYDLYQLNNANGKHLRLFEIYANKVPLSENCHGKMAFYELFTEIEHYYKSGYPVVQRRIKAQAKRLKFFLER